MVKGDDFSIEYCGSPTQCRGKGRSDFRKGHGDVGGVPAQRAHCIAVH